MENGSTPQQPHVPDQGQEDWKTEARRVNELFWRQLATVGARGVQVRHDPDWVPLVSYDEASGLFMTLPPNAGVPASQNIEFADTRPRPPMPVDAHRYPTTPVRDMDSAGPEGESSPRHAEAEPVTVSEADVLLTTRQLSKRWGLGYTTVRRMMEEDPDLPVTRLGLRSTIVRHKLSEVEEYEARHGRVTPDREPRDGGDGPGRRPKGRKRRT